MVGGRALRVDESDGQRWELALEQLAAGETIIFRGVSLTVLPGTLRALIESTWTTSAEQTPERARADIARAEQIVGELLAASRSFAELVGDREVEYHAIDDYGMGAIWLAELRGGDFKWTGPPHYGADPAEEH